MEKLGFNAGYFLMQLFGLIILVILLKAFLYDPILNALEARKARIAKGLEDARQAEFARANAEKEAAAILDNARTEAARIRAQAEAVVEERMRKAEGEAHESARQILTRAEADAAERRNQALGNLRSQIAAISIAAANKIVGESLDEKRQHELINSFFSKVPAGVSQLSGDHAEITSALPLTESEKSAARKAVAAPNVDFRVNPDILGGLIVRVGDQVVDNSVASQMSGLRESLR
jgi:F-type H+-transporting ATPase subunit b